MSRRFQIVGGVIRPGEVAAVVIGEAMRRDVHEQLDAELGKDQPIPYGLAPAGVWASKDWGRLER